MLETGRHQSVRRSTAVGLLITVLLAAPARAAAPSAPTSGPTTTTVPDTTTTTTVPDTTTTTTLPETTTTAPEVACVPATTTTTTTTLPGPTTSTTTTTTTTTTLAPGATTSTTTTTLPPPPCPTTTPPPPPPPPDTEPPEEPGIAPAPLGIQVPKNIGDILLTIRTVESGGNYTIGKNRGGASGAYQYIDSTWNNYKGYPSAYLAPPHIQDERALGDVNAILWTWKGDVSMVPVIWYYPRAAREPALMDQVPVPWAGNRLTVREYQARWLDVLAFITGQPLGYRLALLPAELRFLSGIPPEVPPSTDQLAAVAFPVLGKALLAPPNVCIEEPCATGTDAVVYGQKLQPVLAAADGVVTAVEMGDPLSGAVTVTIADAAGRTYRYAGLNDDTPGASDTAAPRHLRVTTLARIGTSVRAGQIIGFLGDTDPMPSNEHRGLGDEAVWPHLRLTIHDADGTRLDADALVAIAQRRQACHVAIGPWSLPSDAELAKAAKAAGDDDPISVSALANGGFTIQPDGTVIATGKSTLIVPPEGCAWEPPTAFGPGAAGAKPTLAFAVPIELPASAWVASAVGTVDLPAVAPLMR